MKTTKSRVLVICLLSVFALTGGYLLTRGQAEADDADHTTSFSAANHNFDGVSEASVVATFTTTDDDDDRIKISLFVTPSGQTVEQGISRMETSRTEAGSLSIDSAVAQTELSSGDALRAYFEAWDSSSNSTFTYTRYFTMP